MKKLQKQDRSRKQVREWKQVNDEAQGLLKFNVEQKLILNYLLSLF